MRTVGLKEQHDWIDIAKALSIILVVLNHELIYFNAMGWGRDTAAPMAWNVVGDVFQPVRMPLFFLASGLLASSSLHRDKSTAFRKRIANHLYVYFLWALAFSILMPQWPLPGALDGPVAVEAIRVAVGYNLAWYLWALPVAFYIGWVTREQPAWIPIAAAFLLAALPIDHHYSVNLFRCLPYFILGLRITSLADRVDTYARARYFAAGLLLFLVLFIAEREGARHLRPLTEFAGVATGAIGCALLSRASAAVTRVSRWLGKRTLAIYLLQFPLLLLIEYGAPHLIPDALRRSMAFVTVSPLLVTAIVVGLALLSQRLLVAHGWNWLFQMPAGSPVVSADGGPERKIVNSGM